MAGDWIPMRLDLIDSPGVLKIAADRSISRQHVVGCLHAVWAWFNRHTTNGRAKNVTLMYIDELAGVTGFAQAMKKAGWLSVTDDGLLLPRFGSYMSQSAKTRALTARRVARYRQRQRNDDGVNKSLPEDSTGEKST